MKKIILYTLIVLMLVSPVAMAHPKVTITLDGKVLQTDVAPVIRKDRTFVPIRFISEALGYQVSWNSDKRQALIEKDGKNITLTIDKKDALVKGEKKVLDVPPFIEKERTMVPLRFIAENMDVKVGWDQKNYTVVLERLNNTFSFMEQLDLSLLKPEDLDYLKAFDRSQIEITELLKEFRSYNFENFNKYTKEELTAILDQLSGKIMDAANRGKNLQPSAKYVGSQKLYQSILDKVPGILKDFKEAMLNNDSKAAGALVTRLSEFSIYTHQVVESIKAETKGETYVPPKDLQDYNDKSPSYLDNVIKKLEDLYQ